MIFAPSRNAVFARLNLVLPEAINRWLLFILFPKTAEGHQGFKAYYYRCTSKQIEMIARANGLEVVERRLFWMSTYFTVFTPAFVVWRLWQLLAYVMLRDNSAETFTFVLRKR